MDPITGLIAGGASLLGSIFSSDTSAQNTQANIMAQEQMQGQTQQFNASQAQLNRDFQEQMSSTAYQRSRQDMLKAGLNPAMMFGSGGPASVPGGSTASVGTPNMALSQKTSPFAGIGDAVKTAITSSVQAKEMDRLTEQTAQTDLVNRALKRELDAGKPEVDVDATRAATGERMARSTMIDQMRNMNIPEEQKAKIWDALPKEVKQGVVWSDVAAQAATSTAKAASAPASIAKSYLDLIPGYRALTGGSSATSNRKFYNMGLEERDRRSSMMNAPPANFSDRFE